MKISPFALFGFSMIISIIMMVGFFATAHAQETEEVIDGVTETVGNISQDVVDALPDSVKERANKAGIFLEKFRLNQLEKITEKRDASSEHITTTKVGNENGPETENKVSMFVYIKDIFWKITHLIFSVKVLFYVVGGILIFSILRWFFRRLFRPSWDV